MIYVTAVHMNGGSGHEHIASVRWQNPQNATTETSTREVIVDWIENKHGVAKVTDGTATVDVGVVDGNPPYLRTYADGRWTNNLLALPRY